MSYPRVVANGVSNPPTTELTTTIRDIRGAEEFRACQALQRRAWGITEDGYVLPVALMAGAQKVDGLVLGAFDASGGLIGFAFGFLGRLQDRLILYSQITGVHPAHQRTGVGRQLKLEQRRRARDMGLAAVVWAFDPLQATNASFNLGVLGATCRTYEVDLYGSRTDALNAGLDTDRLLAEWSTAPGEAAGKTAAWTEAPDLIETLAASDRAAQLPVGVRGLSRAVERVSIEIPPDLAAVKAGAPAGEAQAWQRAVRAAFQAAFGAGFVAVGFTRADPLRPRYLLERR
jgi:predicted GNAT superfamily acetyltransferase